jgi:chromosome segregation ATPase
MSAKQMMAKGKTENGGKAHLDKHIKECGEEEEGEEDDRMNKNTTESSTDILSRIDSIMESLQQLRTDTVGSTDPEPEEEPADVNTGEEAQTETEESTQEDVDELAIVKEELATKTAEINALNEKMSEKDAEIESLNAKINTLTNEVNTVTEKSSTAYNLNVEIAKHLKRVYAESIIDAKIRLEQLESKSRETEVDTLVIKSTTELNEMYKEMVEAEKVRQSIPKLTLADVGDNGGAQIIRQNKVDVEDSKTSTTSTPMTANDAVNLIVNLNK